MTRNLKIALGAGIGFLVVLIAGIAIAASGGDEEAAPTTTTAPTTTVPATTTTAESTTTTTSTTSTTTTTTTTTTTVPRQPLTGEPVKTKGDKESKAALVVKIDNAPPARPNHTGLAAADIVFEEIVEGDLTRFAAVFHSRGSDPVGPIRSGRTQDVNLMASFNEPLFAWSGGNRGVTEAIANSTLVDLNHQTHVSAYYRGPGGAPNNLYSNTDTLWALTPEDHPGPPPQQYEYLAGDQKFKGNAVTGFDMQMAGVPVRWDWNEERGQFERSQVGREHWDQTHGRIGATNVVALGTDYMPSPADWNSPEAQTLGRGPVYVYSDGKVRRGEWYRDKPEQPLMFERLDGTPLKLNPGNTWIELGERSPTEHADTKGISMDIHYVEAQE